MNSVIITNDDPSPVRHILDLLAELGRVRAELTEAREDAKRWQDGYTLAVFERGKREEVFLNELAEAREYSDKQHSAIVRDTLEIDELEAAVESWTKSSDMWRLAHSAQLDLTSQTTKECDALRASLENLEHENKALAILHSRAVDERDTLRAEIQSVWDRLTKFYSISQDDYEGDTDSAVECALYIERAECDALRARLQALEAAAQSLISIADRAQVEIDHNQFEQTAGDLSEAIDAMRATLAESEMTK